MLATQHMQYIQGYLECPLRTIHFLRGKPLVFLQQIAKLRLQLQRSKQVSRQSKDRDQQQGLHTSTTCHPQVSSTLLLPPCVCHPDHRAR